MVARRSLAGFAAVHNELLHRCRELSSSLNRSQTIARRPNTERVVSRQTFVSYVVEDTCDYRSRETVIIPNPGTVLLKSNTFPAARTNDKSKTSKMVNEIIDMRGDEDKTVKDTIEETTEEENDTEIQNGDYAHAAATFPTKQPPVTLCAANDIVNCDTNTGSPYYVNAQLAELTESDHIYEIPKFMSSQESSACDNETTNSQATENTKVQVHNIVSCRFESDSESDYIEASSTSYTFKEEKHQSLRNIKANSPNEMVYLDQSASLTNPHSMTQSTMLESDPVKDSHILKHGDHTYVNVLHGHVDDLHGHVDDNSVEAENEYIPPEHLDHSPNKDESDYILLDQDSENEYVLPEPAEPDTNTVENPRSASVAHVIPLTGRQTTHCRPRVRPFLMYTVEEVAVCFEECALPQLANICKDENLDGEYLSDLSDSELAQEPFHLNQFHVSKVRKIIAGWRPKRQSMHDQ